MNRPIDLQSSERQAQSSPVPRELELIDYLAAVLGHRRLVLALALAFGLLGALVSLIATRQYAASTLIAVTPSRLDTRMSDGQAAAALVPVLQADPIVARMLADVGLDRPPHVLSPRAFVRSHLTIEPVDRTSFLQVTVTLPEGELAQRAADELSRLSVTRFRALGEEEGGGLETTLRLLAAQAEERYDASGRTLREFRTAAQIDLLRKDVEARLGQRSEFLSLLVKIDAERGRLERAERELASRPELQTTTDTIMRNPLLAEAARAEPGGTAVLGLRMESQQVNDARREIDVSVATARSTLAALERQRDQMIKLGQVTANVLPMLSDLYAREAQLARHQLDHDVAAKAFEEAASAAQSARLRTSMHLPFAQVAERATRPTTPESRRLVRNTAIGLVAGATLACLIAFGHLAVARIALLPGHAATASRPDGPHVES